MHRLFWLLLIVTVVLGGSYAAGLMSRFMGPWSSVAIHQDGSVSHMQFATELPRPEWVPVYPGAWVVQSSKITAAYAPSGFHSLDIATRASLEEVRRFYVAELTASGFRVEDLGIGPLNPLTAAYLGVAGMLSATRAATDDRIDIQIRTPDGLIPSRLLQIHWRKISEMPATALPAAASSGSP
jgi:hypothetical protein